MPDNRMNVEVLNLLLDELDTEGRERETASKADDYWVCQRRHPRYPFRTKCMIRFFVPGTATISGLPGRTRNLSRSGIAFLVRRPFAPGEAIELEVHAPGRPQMYMAGLVTFARYAGRGWHEVGLTLKAAQPEPVFSADPTAAFELYDWLHESVRVPWS